MAEEKDERSDVSLLNRIAQGDAAAMSRLYRKHAPVLHAIVLPIVGERGEADDVLQELFVRIWERATTYEVSLGAPRSWLAHIARNKAIDRVRSRMYRSRSTEERLDLQDTVVSSNLRMDPESIVSHWHTQSALLKALSLLPLSQRTLIEHAYFRGFTQTELAAHFELPLGTVKTRMRLGLSALRGHLTGLLL